MAIPDLSTLEYKLKQRGFKRGDGVLHACETCQERAVLQYVIAGRAGGRDISLCQACGKARAWRSGVGLEGRVEDTNFDLRVFLG